MKPSALTSVPFFLCCFLAVIIFFPSLSAGQEPDRSQADENFELDIKENRVREQNYQRSTRVEIQGSVMVGAGAEVRAQQIDILVRGVTGRVRFRASLGSLQGLIERARAVPKH